MALGYHFLSSCIFLGYGFESFVPRPFLIYFFLKIDLKNRVKSVIVLVVLQGSNQFRTNRLNES